MLPLKKQGQQPTEGAAIPVQVRRDEREGKAVRLSATIHTEIAYADQLAQAKAQGSMPACLVPPPNAWQTCLAALDPAAIEEVICERRVDVGAVQRWCAQHAPELSARVRHVPLRDWQPERAEADEEIAAALEETVTLPCGGNLLIEPVRTLTAIDVNSGGATRKAGMELTALTVNLEAAREVPRQLALRNLGGIVGGGFHRPREPQQAGAGAGARCARRRRSIRRSSGSATCRGWDLLRSCAGGADRPWRRCGREMRNEDGGNG